jgi:hypothetical protein
VIEDQQVGMGVEMSARASLQVSLAEQVEGEVRAS